MKRLCECLHREEWHGMQPIQPGGPCIVAGRDPCLCEQFRPLRWSRLRVALGLLKPKPLPPGIGRPPQWRMTERRIQ